jgi:tetratricopeptide (TPR) repeat protein
MRSIPETFDLALRHHQAGNHPLAEQLYRQILEAEPQHVNALHLLGVLAYQAGKYNRAVDFMEQALRLAPKFAEAYINLGMVLKDQGKRDAALLRFRQALRLKPNLGELHILVGILLAEQGKYDEAITSYQQALCCNPNTCDAHNNLGNALQAQGKLDGAIASYRQALFCNPDSTEAHNNLGNALKDQGKLDEAVASYQRAISLKSDFAEAHNNLGTAFQEQEKLEEAIACYQQALWLKPDCAKALFNLANTLVEQVKHDEAIACYRQALRLKPDYAEAHNRLGNAFKEQGKLEEAIACYRQALRIKPDFPLAWWNLGEVADFDSADMGQLEAMLANQPLPLQDRSVVHRTLAQCLDQRQDYAAAFSHLHQANALRKQDLQRTGKIFNPASFREYVAGHIALFDEAYFRQQARGANTSELPVFVVGMPRSGTTLVEQILASHAQVFGAGELNAVPQMVAALNRIGGRPGGYLGHMRSPDRANLQELADRHLARLTQLGGGAARVIDKMPGNFLHLGLIALLFPHARVIHCVRDPLDVCLSCYFQNFSKITYSLSLEDLGFYYRDYERLMAHWRRVLPLRMIEVRYEDLVARQHSVSRDLVAFCGLEWNDSCLSFYKNRRPVQTASVLQVRRPIYSNSVGRWQRYAAYLEPLRNALGLRDQPPSPIHPETADPFYVGLDGSLGL